MLKTFKYYSDIERDGILLIYRGTISQDMLADIGTNLKMKLQNENFLGKKVFAIFIELAQNVYHHSAEKDFSLASNREAGAGILIVQEKQDAWFLCSGNLIEKNDSENLKEKCHYINSLDENGLREFYKYQRRQPKGGTGGNIGLIDMVRKSGNPMDFDLEDVDSKNSFFSLQIKINKN